MELDSRFTAVAILGVYAVVAGLERISPLQRVPSPLLRPSFATDVGWYVTAVAVTLAFGPALEQLARWRSASAFPDLASFEIRFVLLVIAATVLYDLGATLCHMLLHRYEPLWNLHKVHHSSPVLDWLATTRAHGLEHVFRGIPTQAALFTLGFPSEAVAAAIVIYAGFATAGHSNLRLPLAGVEVLFVTPRLHRLHHVPATTNRNFGTVLTLWDRLFGHFAATTEHDDAALGVPGEVETYPQSWKSQLIEPFGRRRRVIREPHRHDLGTEQIEDGALAFEKHARDT